MTILAVDNVVCTLMDVYYNAMNIGRKGSKADSLLF